MSQLLDWHSADPADLVKRLLPILADGGVIVFPSETIYLAACCPFLPSATAALPNSPALAVRDLAAALDWAPGLGKMGRRLARRCWPGPLVLQCADTTAPRLPDCLRQRLPVPDALPLRSPAHEALLTVLGLLPWPLAVASVTHDGQPATTAEMAQAALADRAALVIDDGPTHFGMEASVVRVQGDHWQIVSEGVLTKAALERLAPKTILFVCTGNTCRSPLAEALCKKMLAGRLGCSVEELPQRGFVVLSAGLQAMMGGAAADEAVKVASALGADLAGHHSQPVTAELLTRADFIIGMTRSHVRTLAGYLRGDNAKLRLLAPDGQDLPDPIGAAEDVYRGCAQQIIQHLEELLPELE